MSVDKLEAAGARAGLLAVRLVLGEMARRLRLLDERHRPWREDSRYCDCGLGYEEGGPCPDRRILDGDKP